MRIPYTSWSPDTAPFYAEGENTAQNCMPYQEAPNYSQSLAPSLSTIGQPNSGPYQANAASFPNLPYMVSGSLAGATSNKVGAISLWIRIDGSTGGEQTIFELSSGSTPDFRISYNASGHLANFRIVGANSAGTTILDMSTSAGYSPGATWYNLLASWNLATAATSFFVNNSSDKTTTTATNDTINYGDLAAFALVGVSRPITNKLFASLAEVWFTNAFVDFTVSGNRAAFISGGFPVNLGSTGQTPTGSSPLLYLKSTASQFNVNSGTGGNFAITNGPLAIASTSPSAATALSQVSGSISVIDANGLPHTYIGNSTQLAEITATSSTNVSKAAGYTANIGWEFASFTAAGIDNIYATDYTDAIQVMAVGATVLADLGGSPPKAKHMAQVGQFLMLGNTNGGVISGVTQGAVPNRIWWPQIGNPASWPDPTTLTAAGDQSSFQDLNLAYGAIQHISPGQKSGKIYQEHGITLAYYIGGGPVFDINTYEKQRGCLCVNGVVTVGDIDYFIDQSGFFETDGAQVVPIGHDVVDKTWLADVNTAYLDHVRGAHDASNKCIWWTYPSLTATLQGTFVSCDKVIVYNYSNKRWAMGYVGQTIDHIFSAFTLGYTMEQLDSVNSNLDLITPSLDSPYWNGGQPIVGLFGIQQVGTSGAYASYYGTFSGAALTATIDTKEMNLNESGLALVTAVNPVVMGATLSSIQVAPITRNTLSAAGAVGTLATPEPRTGKASMRSTARYHVFRTVITGGFTNAMGVEPEYTNAGNA